MRIVILDEAINDLIQGAQFYDRQEPGLGEYFLNSLYADIDSLQLYAGIHLVQFGKHRLLSKRFPFGIYYTVESDEVRVFAILDLRRDPTWIRDRLGS